MLLANVNVATNSRPFYFHTLGDLDVNSVMLGIRGLAKAGAGTLTISQPSMMGRDDQGNNVNSINEGTLKLNAGTNTLYFRTPMVIDAGKLDLNSNSQYVMDLMTDSAVNGGEIISTGGNVFEVQDTQKIKADVFGHHGVLTSGSLKVGDTVSAQVNMDMRAKTIRNHSATHLMHKALREVLGEHVQQKGSLVNAERTRFDFAHNAPVTDAQITAIEAKVNAEILDNAQASARVMDIEAAKATGAMMLFGEKYGDSVRVLNIGSSIELCGGCLLYTSDAADE